MCCYIVAHHPARVPANPTHSSLMRSKSPLLTGTLSVSLSKFKPLSLDSWFPSLPLAFLVPPPGPICSALQVAPLHFLSRAMDSF